MRDNEQSLASVAVPTRAAEALAAHAEVAASPFNLRAGIFLGRAVPLVFLGVIVIGFYKMATGLWFDGPVAPDDLPYCVINTLIFVVGAAVLALLPLYGIILANRTARAYKARGLI